jgi:hypothetical protein
MNYKNILRLLSILLFSLTCDEAMLPKDCLGIEGGSATMDECGVCDTDEINDNVTCKDCTGEINGIHVWDECNVCDIYSNSGGIKPSYPYGGPYGFCDCTGVLNGDAIEDYCGGCEGTCESGNPDSCERLDDCNVCDGDNSPNTGICDCLGVPDGTLVEDCTGICAGDAVEDYCGDCEGTCESGNPDSCERLDDCNVCDGDNSPNTGICDCFGIPDGTSVEDCAGICEGDAEVDNCGDCVDEDSAGDEACSLDCNGVDGGSAYYDDCDVCVDLGDISCVESCDGNYVNDGSQKVNDECGICGGDNSTCADCANVTNGDAELDQCGICNGDNSTCADCANVPNGDSFTDSCNECVVIGDTSCVQGCDGNYANDGTQAVVDECGICSGDNTTCLDCAGTPNGTAYTDGCSYCIGGNTGNEACSQDCFGIDGGSAFFDNCNECVPADDTSCVQGCDGNYANDGTQAVVDECEICSGDNSTCLDCADVPNGDSFTDNCNECVAVGDTSCIQGCDGNYANDGSHAVDDECGVCDGDDTTCLDCAGTPNGDAIIDCSGECRGGNTGLLTYTICGCFDTNADNFYCHQDAGECYNTPSVDTCCENNTSVDVSCNSDCILSDNVLTSQFSNPYIDSEECEYSPNPLIINQGCVDAYENPNYGLVYNDTSLCEYYGCTDVNATNYDETANVGDGNCTYAEASLFFGEITNSTIEIFMQNSEAVGGFQFDLTGGSILSGSASGGSADGAGFSVSTGPNGVIGFSFGDDSIPTGSGLLTIVDASLVSEPICIDNIVISDASGGNLNISTNPICSE